MFKSKILSVVLFLLLVDRSLADGCATHTYSSCADGIIHWFDPGTGQICDPLDCGGGAGAPRTDVPGCPFYKGTELPVTTISYLSCFKQAAVATAITTLPVADTTVSLTLNMFSTAPGPVSVAIVSFPTSTSATADGSSTISSSESTTTTLDPRLTSSGTLTTSSRSSSSSSSASAKQSNVAVNHLDRSLMGIAGAAIGALALL
jgi:hypothetical protein